MVDRARELYERFVNGGESMIDEFIASQLVEDLFLDYKISADNGGSLPALHSSDRKNFGKAVSGFGNSEGGVLVWGIRCGKDKSGADVPTEKVPLADCKRFLNALNGVVGGMSIPVHARVEGLCIPREDGSGFVVSLIPRSFSAPHQAAFDKKYYIRAGSNFEPASHSVIVGLLDRRPVPEPFIKVVAGVPKIQDSDTVEVEFGLSYLHEGPGLLEDCYVSVTVFNMPGGNCSFAMLPTTSTRWQRSLWLDTRFSAILNSPLKLAPFAADQPFVFSATFKQPIELAFRYEIALGAKGTPVKIIRVNIPPELMRDALAESIQKSWDRNQGYRLVDRLLGMDQWPSARKTIL